MSQEIHAAVRGALAALPQHFKTIAISVTVIVLATVFISNVRARKWAGVTYTVPIPEQCKRGWEGKLLENPLIMAPGSNDIQCYCPASGKLLGFVRLASPADIDTAIAEASKAQKSWAQTSFDERRKVLRTLQRYILANQDAIVQASCLDSWKTRVDATLGEILVTTEKIKYLLDYGEKTLRPEKRPTSFLMVYKNAELRYEPLGVVAALVSWNYPVGTDF